MVTIPIVHHRGGGSWDCNNGSDPGFFPPPPSRFSQTNRSRISRFLSSPPGGLHVKQEAGRLIPIQIEQSSHQNIIGGRGEDSMHRQLQQAPRKIEIVIERRQPNRDLASSSSWVRHSPTSRSLSCGTVGASPFRASKAFAFLTFQTLWTLKRKRLEPYSELKLVSNKCMASIDILPHTCFVFSSKDHQSLPRCC